MAQTCTTWLSREHICMNKITQLGWLALLWAQPVMQIAAEFGHVIYHRIEIITFYFSRQVRGLALPHRLPGPPRPLWQSTRWDLGRPNTAAAHCLPSPALWFCSLYRSQLICFHLIAIIIGLIPTWDYVYHSSTSNTNDGSLVLCIDSKLVMLQVTLHPVSAKWYQLQIPAGCTVGSSMMQTTSPPRGVQLWQGYCPQKHTRNWIQIKRLKWVT